MPSPERLNLPKTPIENQPAKPTETDPASELFERLKLKEQYLAQVKVLYASHLLENFPATSDHPKPELGLTDIMGERHYLPKLADLRARLNNPETRQFIEKKYEQGFAKLLLVPFGLPLNTLIERYKQTLLKVRKETGIKATDGSTLDLNEDDPLYVWDDLKQADNPQTPQGKQLEYQVKNYDGQTKPERGGQTKQELLQQDPDNAWQFLLIEDLPDLPAENRGQTVAGRKQLEANKNAKEYLKLLQQDRQYQGEQGLTPEANLALYLTKLQEDHLAIDDYSGQGKANRLVGSYLSGVVPLFYWGRGGRQPNLSGRDPGDRGSHSGCRSSARF
jgi:hypothetical protein